MNVCLISDPSHSTGASSELKQLIIAQFSSPGNTITVYDLTEGDLAPCAGCFCCWLKTPGECIYKDKIAEMNPSFMHSDLVIYLTPVTFGGCSSTIKNALDRTLPNRSPFFTKKNGFTTHKKRYQRNPKVIMIGYGDSIPLGEQETFLEWATTHSFAKTAYLCRSQTDIQTIGIHLRKDENNE